MMLDQLDKAEAHTITAIRRLEMMLWFIRQKKLKPENHIPAYFDLVANDLVQIQNAILSDDEYTEYVARGLARVSKTHTYEYQVTSNNDGKIFYNVDALLPLKEMKENVIFVRSLP
jgi:hypothetical protein